MIYHDPLPPAPLLLRPEAQATLNSINKRGERGAQSVRHLPGNEGVLFSACKNRAS